MLARHPKVQIEALTSSSYIGRRVDEVFPHLRVDDGYVAYTPGRVAGSDVVFVCYPHGDAHPVVAELVDAGQRVLEVAAEGLGVALDRGDESAARPLPLIILTSLGRIASAILSASPCPRRSI